MKKLQLSLLFTVVNQLKTDHLQTKMHAEHLALGTAYDELSDLFDTYAELVYGVEGIPTEQVVYSSKVESYRGNLISRYTNLCTILMEHLTEVTGTREDLKNTQADIQASLNHLLYRLQQS